MSPVPWDFMRCLNYEKPFKLIYTNSEIYLGRAVLGRQNEAGDWEAVVLSVDQNGYNMDEVARLQSEHPNEPDMIKDGRLLGLAVTRAFGDGIWKV